MKQQRSRYTDLWSLKCAVISESYISHDAMNTPPPDCFLTHLQCHRKGDPTHQPVNWCLCQMVFSFPSRHLCCCFKIPLGYIERSPSSATDMPKLASDSGINLVASGMNLNNLAAVNPCFVGFMQELAD